MDHATHDTSSVLLSKTLHPVEPAPRSLLFSTGKRAELVELPENEAFYMENACDIPLSGNVLNDGFCFRNEAVRQSQCTLPGIFSKWRKLAETYTSPYILYGTPIVAPSACLGWRNMSIGDLGIRLHAGMST